MRTKNLIAVSIAASLLASCGKPEPAKQVSVDPCDSAKAQPPYLTQGQAVKACKDNRAFAGSPTKRSNIQVTNH
jgi:hypothetical protein